MLKNHHCALKHPSRYLPSLTQFVVASFMLGSISACSIQWPWSEPAKDATKVWPELALEVTQQQDVELRVAELLRSMTLEQKIAQMIQPEIRDISVEDMRQYGFGAYLNGGGSFPNSDKHATPDDWIALAESMYQASIDDSLDGSSIPTMWGTDAVHGHNNVIGATLFPHNIGLGAANNPELIEQIATITAREVMVTGIDWVFAPTVAVVRDDRWGRTYEGYSEDPEIVKAYAASIVKGLQGQADMDFLSSERVVATVKHYLGDGGTLAGIDQGDNIATEQQLFDLHAQGYVSGLTVGAQTVMASFNSWHGVKSHGNRYLLTDVLKQQMGFDGFVVGDWNGHGQIAGCSVESCPQAVNAGLDMFMAPTPIWKELYHNTLAEVRNGDISQERIDDAVTRILRVKVRAGLFDKPSPEARVLSGNTELIGAQAHRDIARQAVRESLVLLKNDVGLLPLSTNQIVMVAGDGADNIGKQSGGWSITWQGTDNANSDFPGGSSIFDGIQSQVKAGGGKSFLNKDGKYAIKPDVAIVVFGEEPYAEGLGDRNDMSYQSSNQNDLALLRRLKSEGIPVVSVFISGRPMWVNAEINASDAFVAAWLPGSEGKGIAEVLFQDPDGNVQFDFTGRLSFSWPNDPSHTAINRFDEEYPPLFPYGYGLSYGDSSMVGVLNETLLQSDEFDGSLAIFNRETLAPWQMKIGSTDEQILVSSVEAQGEVVSLRSSDKNVQEDARSLTFNGHSQGFVSFTSHEPLDLSAFIESASHLYFSVNIAELGKLPVELSMGCTRGCDSSVNLLDDFAKLPKQQWSTIAVPLRCFANSGVDFTQISSPFTLSTRSSMAMSLADIEFRADKDLQADLEVSCL